ncbi:MAG: SIR2 family protein [Sulfitobacter litoralis]|uniref:SIR2 family protein n=1 Tax=Sulfitobacter TaxID=60136 RepID=UPI000C0F53E7|nr:SIR2 family protein [Roseobacter sp.]MBV49870.1 SIR2 family protein [Roseobacter sp.]PHR02290.1 MAG: SIR2 family protein [Sulfitobacter sp.]
MANFWDGEPKGKKELLRLLTRDGKWRQWESEKEDPADPSKKPKAGCKDQLEEALLAALHSTNVVVLLGSGASFSAKNEGGPIAPGMWHLWQAVKTGCGEAGFNDIAKSVFGHVPVEGEENIEALLSLCKMSIEMLEVRTEKDGTSPDYTRLKKLKEFVTTAEREILVQVGFVRSVTELPAHTGFLRKFARRSPEKPRVKLFTTNYDLCIETAGLRLGVVLIDGFSHSAEQRFNRDHFDHDIVRRAASSTKADYLDGVFRLYKLHGSVDWRRRSDDIVIRSVDDPSEDRRPVLIYPRSSKYQEAFESPYLDMFAALQAALREPDTTLIVSGFGFADDHISAPIWSAIETNLSLRLVLCDRGFVEHQKLFDEAQEIDLDLAGQRPYQQKIARLVQQGDTRITMLNGRFEDLADALPMISGKTDRQLLQDRLEKLREGDGA